MGGDNVLERVTWLLERSGDAALVTDSAGAIEYVNPAFEAMTGYAPPEVIGRTPAILKSGRQSAEFYRELWNTLRAGKEFRGVLLNRRRDGSLFHEEKTIRPLFDESGSLRHYLSSGRDVSLRMAALEKLRHDATHDALTDLPNRALYLDRLQQALAHAARSGERLAIAVIDVDGFKSINDEWGHEAGDAALQAIARRLHMCVRKADTAARLGGDEFALLLHDAGDAARVLHAVLQACTEPMHTRRGQAVPLSVSVGVSRYPDDARDAEALLRCADEAMYRAKREGGGRCRSNDQAEKDRRAARAGGLREPADSGLALLEREVPVLRRMVRPGDSIYRAGEPFRDLHIMRVGLCKLYSVSAEGREELTTMLFKGDWLGFDGLADGQHTCSAMAADTGELWTVRYGTLLRAGLRNSALLAMMHTAMARQNARERDAALTMHALSADGRVAAFLCRWADELEHCGLRNDQITLPATRAEIGGHVGLRLESVSRAMSNLERERLIRFGSRNRRDIEIPNLPALRQYVRRIADGGR
jgi:diguanylate cyclase (GGDEF)-like protein/PAS domain S-box-containing protein